MRNITKQEIRTFTKEIAAKIARGGISARPLSADKQARLKKLLQRKREENAASIRN